MEERTRAAHPGNPRCLATGCTHICAEQRHRPHPHYPSQLHSPNSQPVVQQPIRWEPKRWPLLVRGVGPRAQGPKQGMHPQLPCTAWPIPHRVPLIRSNKAPDVPRRPGGSTGRVQSGVRRRGRHPHGTAPLASAGTELALVGAPALRTRRSRSPAPPPPPTSLPRPPTPPPGCWQWDGPWGCGGEGAAARQAPAPALAECPPCALAGPPPAPQPLPGDASFYSLPPPPLPPNSEAPEPSAPSPSASPSPQAVCWPSGWH